jgi:hypothetical protein
MTLSKQSKKLILFFTKNKCIKYQKITNKTITILKELYNKLLNGYKYVNKYNINKNKILIKKIHNVNQISKPQSFNSNSFPEIIRRHIDKTMMSEISYSFSLYERNVKVIFIVENDDIEINIDIYNKHYELIFIWLHILNTYASNKECSKNITIYLYLTSLEKHLPKSNNSILDEYNVNTAFTSTCPKDSEIVVFRKEEWFKVFIHETLHNFSLDFSIMNNDYITNCILNIFKVNSEVNAYEAYTEFWAEIINSIFCSFYSIRDKNNINEFLSNCEFCINFERTYSYFQLVKTLHFMGLSYNDLYSKTNHSKLFRENLYKEKSNVLSYYVIKTILINNYQGFLYWCQKNNLSLLDFKKTLENQKEFCIFIERNYKTPSLLDNINETNIFYSKLYIRKNKSLNYILSNLRMSICELG